MLHVILLRFWPLYCTGYSGVSPGSAGKILEIRTRFILVTLQAFIQAPIWFVEGFIDDITPHANPKTVVPGVHDVVLPYRDALLREANLL